MKTRNSYLYDKVNSCYDFFESKFVLIWRDKMMNCLAVGLGGFAGAVLRYLIGTESADAPDADPEEWLHLCFPDR